MVVVSNEVGAALSTKDQTRRPAGQEMPQKQVPEGRKLEDSCTSCWIVMFVWISSNGTQLNKSHLFRLKSRGV